MTILALEFSSAQRSVAVARGESILSEAEESGGRSIAAFGMIEKVLAEAKLDRGQIEAVAIGLGPGSYTGIRAAIAMAQGWQLAHGVKLLGVSSAECLAAQARAERIWGRINVVIDAQRGEFYLAAWDVSANGSREIAPLKIVSAAEIQSRAVAGEIFIGPEAAKCGAAGKILFPHASTLAELAAHKSEFVPGEKLEPIYLRETNFVKTPAPPRRRL
jgi:tRNA threonylcarbamoyladenosine biosynthesis protein TsaB